MNKALEKWEEKQFESCIENIQYTNKIPKKDFKENGFFPIISQEEEFINGYWDKEKDLFKIKKPLVIFGDHTKNIKYVDFDFVLGADGVKIISTIDDILPKYMYYYLQNIQLRDLGYARHYKLLKEVVVKYPSLSEQQRIVGILDEAFENIEKAKQNALQNLNNAKELFNHYLNQIFTMKNDWIKKNLDDVCVYKSGTTISKDLEKDFGDLLYIKVGDMNLQGNEDCITTSTRYVNLKDINKNQIINNGAIIFPKRGGAIATNKKRKIIKPTIIDLNTMAISTKNEILEDYFYYWFKQINLIDISNGTTIPQINNYSFKDLKIAYPIEKKEQQKIVAQLDELQEQTKKLKQIYEQKIKDLDELKQSILQKAFNGEL